MTRRPPSPTTVIATTPLLLLALLAAPRPAQARAAVTLDGTPDQAVAVVLATVRSVIGGKPETRLGTQVVALRMPLTIEEVIKPPPAPDGAAWLRTPFLHHVKVAPGQPPRPNGVGYSEVLPGRTYVLFLDRDAQGNMVLHADEDPQLIDLSPKGLAKVRATPKAGTTPSDRVAELLEVKLSLCTRACAATVSLLGGSARYRQAIGEGPRRTAFTGQLTRLLQTSREANDVLAAVTLLGELGEKSILPYLVARLSAQPTAAEHKAGVDRIGWLQGFAAADLIAPLREISKRATDPATRDRAVARLVELGQKP